MSRSTMRRNTTPTLLLALLVQGFATACDLKSPVEPDTTRWVPPDHVSYALTLSGITASTVSWSQIEISWARTPSATGYELFRAEGSTGSYTLLTSLEAPITSFSNGGLTGSTQYCYKIRATKNAGKSTTYSAFSSAACATTYPPPVVSPSETEAVPQGGAILVRWRDNSANEDGFRIQRARTPNAPWGEWVEVNSAPANATSAFSYVVWNEQACFRVIGFNSLGSSLPSTPDCTTPPAPPSGLAATADAQGITLTWTDNSAFEDGYRIIRRDQSGVVLEIATLPANEQSYRDASPTPDVTYTYRVQATKDGGYTTGSNEAISVVATSAPGAPNDAYGYFYWDYEGYGWNYLIISWRDHSTNEEGFRIEYSLNGSTGWAEYATSPPNSYYSQAFDVFGPPPPPACYRVLAFNSAGTSIPSNVTCVEPLGAPTDLGATAVGQQTIDLTWTDNASLETGYVVVRSTTSDGVYEKVATLSANATTHRDGGLASGQLYWYLVYATYPDGSWGQPSNYAAEITTVAGAALKASGTRVVTRPAPTVPVRIKGVVPHKRVAPVRETKR
jgi:hypothetical protein